VPDPCIEFGLLDPLPQGLGADTEIVGDLAARLPAGLD
jgi:hypothetical protein